jgi:hypothetical protein
MFAGGLQNKEVLSRSSLPEKLRIAVASNVENNLFSKVQALSGVRKILLLGRATVDLLLDIYISQSRE